MAHVRQPSATTDSAPASLGLYTDPPVLALPPERHEVTSPRLAPYTTADSTSCEVHLLLPPERLAAAVAAAANAAASVPPASPLPPTGTQAIGAIGASTPLVPLLIVVDIHVAPYGSSSTGSSSVTAASASTSAAATPTGAGPAAGLQSGAGTAGLRQTYQQLVLEPSTVEVPAGRVSVNVPRLLLTPAAAAAAASTAPAPGTEAVMQWSGVGLGAVVAAHDVRQASTAGTQEQEQAGPEQRSGSLPDARRRCCGMHLYLFSPVPDPAHAAGSGSAASAAATTGTDAAAAGRRRSSPQVVTGGTVPPPSPHGSASDMCLQCLGWVELLVLPPEAAAELQHQWQQMVWEVRRQADGAAPVDADGTGAAGMATAAAAAAAAMAAGTGVSPQSVPPRYEPCPSAAYQFHMRPLVRDLGLLLLGPGPGQPGPAAVHGTPAAAANELEALRNHLLGWFQATGMEACVELVQGAGPWGESTAASQMVVAPPAAAATQAGHTGSSPHQGTPAATAEAEAAGLGALRVPRGGEAEAGADGSSVAGRAGGAGSRDLSDVQELMQHLATLSGGGRGHPPAVPAAAAPAASAAPGAPQPLLQPALVLSAGAASDGGGTAPDDPAARGPQPQVASPSALELTLQLLSLSHPGPPRPPSPPSDPAQPANPPTTTSPLQPRPGGHRHGSRSSVGPAAVAAAPTPPQPAASPSEQPGAMHRPRRASSLGSTTLDALLLPLRGFPEPTQEAAYRLWRIALAVRNGRDGVWGLPLPLAAGCVVGAVGVVATTLRLRATGITEQPVVKALAGMLWLLVPLAGQAARMWVLRAMGTEAAAAGGRVSAETSGGEKEKITKTAEAGGAAGSAGTSGGSGGVQEGGSRRGGRAGRAATEGTSGAGEGIEVSCSLVLYDTIAAASTGLLASLLGLLTYTCSRPCLDVRQDDPGFVFGILMGRAVFPPLAVQLLVHEQLLVCVGMWAVDLVHVWVLWSGAAPAWVLLLGPVLVACVSMAVCGVLDVRSRREFVRTKAGQRGAK